MDIHHAVTAAEVAECLNRLWSGPRRDPFGFDLAVVPSAGWQRWLSQQLATGPQGICAGIEFNSLGRFRARLLDADDPWRPHRLAWVIQQLITDHEHDADWSVLCRHLEATHDSYAVTARIATHLAGYADHAPEMLDRWRRGEAVDRHGDDLAEQSWQPLLWRALVERTGIDPVIRHQHLLQRLRQSPHPELAGRIAVVAPARLDAALLELLQATGSHHQVDLLAMTTAPGRRPQPGATGRAALVRPQGHPLNLALGALGDENATFAPAEPACVVPERADNLLGWLADDLANDRPPVRRQLSDTDQSVQLHFSHGASRQVEVLREVLAQLYADDPTVEPRHVAVLTPDPEGFGPLLDAAFNAATATRPHPASTFRLQLADRSLAAVNPLVGLLSALLRLPDSRAEASAVLELCAHPGIARRFGFTADTQERLTELVTASGVRWGLNSTQRAEFGLGALPQNTWQAGLQRLLLGVTMSEQDLVSVGTVLPLDDIDSSDVELIGALTEVIGRLSRWLAEVSRPATLADWVQRCRAILADLIALPPSAQWQSADLLSGLAQLAEDGASAAATTLISRHSALAAIEHRFAESPARSSFGNGSTVVSGLTSLDRIPHRVVVLLGWDADRYPRPDSRHGDDLLGQNPPTGVPSAGMADRQALLNAIQAAQQSLIVICRGRSEATNADVPPATPIADLIDTINATAATASGTPAAVAISRRHPLQPFAPQYFTPGSGLHSVDPLAFRAARAWQQAATAPVNARNRYQLQPLPVPDLAAGLTLAQLVDFYRHPARTLLKVRAGLNLADDPGLDDQIPIEPDGLQRWQIGNRAVDQLRAGADPATVERAEWLRGQVPPLNLGRQLMATTMTDALRTLEDAPPASAGSYHDVAIAIPGPQGTAVSLTGRVLTHQNVLWHTEFSSLQPRQKLSAWILLLALSAAEPGPWQAMVIGKRRRTRLVAPPSEVATDLLARYLQLYALGLSQPLPALPRLNAEWAAHRVSARDPRSGYAAKGLRRTWDWESDVHWNRFFHYPELLELPVDGWTIPGADPAESSLVGAVATAIWAPLLDAEVAP